MPLRTPEQYFENLSQSKRVIYHFGEKLENFIDHPVLRPAVNTMKITFGLCFSPEYEDIMTTTSPFTGEKINRLLQVHTTKEDYLKRAEQNYALMKLHACCVGGRCVGNDAINAIYDTTYDMDQKLGTGYHKRFVEWLKTAQTQDLAVSGMITDVKGDRSKPPSEQADPDLFLRVVERRKEGVVIRGAKAHQSGASVADYHLICPTQSMSEKDKDYALSCAVDANSPGIIHVFETPAGNLKRLFTDLSIDLGNPKFGVHASSLVIFNDVFVPWERVFMAGEYQFSRQMVDRFANYHRVVFSQCHPAVAELMAGAAAVIADYNGLDWRKVSHMKEKVTEILHLATTSRGCGIGSITLAKKAPSGSLLPDPMMVNSAKLAGVKAQLDAGNYLADIAGGLVGTIPSEKDLRNPEIGEYVDKYLKGKATVSTEDRMKMFRFIEYLIGMSSSLVPVTLHGGGSPETQRVFIRGIANMEELTKQVKKIAAIEN